MAANALRLNPEMKTNLDAGFAASFDGDVEAPERQQGGSNDRFRFPDTFTNGKREFSLAKIAEGKPSLDTEIYLSVRKNSNDYEANIHLVRALENNGYNVTFAEYEDQEDWPFWSKELERVFRRIRG